MKFKFAASALTLFFLAAHSPANGAEEAEINAIIKSLAPIAGQTLSPGYNKRNHRQVIIRNRKVILSRANSIDIEVYFEFDKFHLTRRAKGELAALGRALESRELRPFRYLVAGHTDAKGTAAYNQQLSDRRAASVMRFLIENYAIDPSRLTSIGWGERQLKSPDHPRSAINRRVEITLIIPRDGLSGLERGDTEPVGLVKSETTLSITEVESKTGTIESESNANATTGSRNTGQSAPVGEKKSEDIKIRW